LGNAAVAVLITDSGKFVFQDALKHIAVAEEVVKVVYAFLKLLIFILQFFPVKALQSNEPHIADCLGLYVVQTEAGHQVILSVIVAGTDDFNDLVNIILGNEEAL